MDKQDEIVIKVYKCKKQADAMAAYRRDAPTMVAQGYFPRSQSWAPGTYGCGSFLVALLLCVFLIGFVVFFYMLIVKPEGTLTVTYERRSPLDGAANAIFVEEKTCPRCAERVKSAALVCRFCGHEFSPASLS